MHPLDPLTGPEISQVSSLLRAQNSGKELHFKSIALLEPPKHLLRPFLIAERTASHHDVVPSKEKEKKKLVRNVAALYYHRGTADLFTARINLDGNVVEDVKRLDSMFHGQADVDEVVMMRDICLSHPKVLDAVKRFELPDHLTLVCDTWPYGRDSEDRLPRYVQCYLFARGEHPGSNHYDMPLPFSPVFDMVTRQLVEIIRLPTGVDSSINEAATYKPHKAEEYHHDLQPQPARSDLKPLIIQQPQGVSFTVDGHLVKWQKWRFRVGFNWREGMLLHDVTYEGRELFHRLGLSEMFVPYGDPRYPYSRKSVFDVGDIGAGVAANNLALGCDCLGSIKYFSFVVTNSKGEPTDRPNAICMHEIDDGIGWKHTNTRNGSVSIVRSRVLVLQTIITVGNYEYIFMWHFDQAAGLHYRIQATGILSTAPIDPGVRVPWGTNVNEGVMAPNHQHVFCLRIDPCIDGDDNTFVEEDSVAMPLSKTDNPFGVGYTTQTRPIRTSGSSDTPPNRIHKIINPSKLNSKTGRPVAYAIHSHPKQMLLAAPSSWHARRAVYATRPFWVTTHRDTELYPAGDYTYQSHPPSSTTTSSSSSSDLGIWAARRDNTENKDIVIWHSISLTHNPRTEDYPVMPCDTMTVSLKPAGFFERNPALDVPQSGGQQGGGKGGSRVVGDEEVREVVGRAKAKL